jgi:hypothetical protein
MRMRKLSSILVLTAVLSAFTGCGGGGGGSGSAEFKTVVVSAAAISPAVPFQLKTANTCPTPNPADGTFVDEVATVTITSTKFPNLPGDASRVFVDSYTVSFRPARVGYPEIPDYIGSTIGTGFTAPGGSVTANIMTAAYKQDLVNRGLIQLCSNNVYEYFATINLAIREETTGTSKNVAASMNIQITD